AQRAVGRVGTACCWFLLGASTAPHRAHPRHPPRCCAGPRGRTRRGAAHGGRRPPGADEHLHRPQPGAHPSSPPRPGVDQEPGVDLRGRRNRRAPDAARRPRPARV
ncbi:MAG: hypothetical protein AVDCRST_MAG66-669, partial [uncultured Pseudonocardia sp.]